MPSTPIWQGTTNAFNTAGNWSTSAVPVTGDSAFLKLSSQDIAAYNASAIVLALLAQDMSYTGKAGDASGYLQIGATIVNLGSPSPLGTGNGSSRINLNFGSTAGTVNILNSATSGGDAGRTPIRLLGSSITAINQIGGVASVAALESESATVTLLNVEGGSMYLGKSCALTTLYQLGGSVVNNSGSAITTGTVGGNGSIEHLGGGGFATMNIDKGGRADYVGTGTIGTLNLTGTLDLSGGGGAVTITNCNAYDGAKIIDPLKRLTHTNPITLVRCSLKNVSLDYGQNRTVQVA